MYCGLNPLDEYSFYTKGMSLKNKNSPGLKKDILKEWMGILKKYDSNIDYLSDILSDIYHYIGKKIIPSISTNEQYLFEKVAIKLSINKTKILTDSKKHQLLLRLRNEGNESNFESEKIKVVPVMPIEKDSHWSLATVHQINEQNLKLNIEKILQDNMSELITMLSAIVECSPTIIDIFYKLMNKNYFSTINALQIKKLLIKKPANLCSRDFKVSKEYHDLCLSTTKVSFEQLLKLQKSTESKLLLDWMNLSENRICDISIRPKVSENKKATSTVKLKQLTINNSNKMLTTTSRQHISKKSRKRTMNFDDCYKITKFFKKHIKE